jgi:acyl-CoA thioester hydrolase
LTAPFVHELRVRYGECDPQGIVFNANYLLYFDVAFTELWRAARFDDELALQARITRLGATAITTEIDVLRDQELLVAGRLRHVCVATDTWSKIDLPEWVRRGLAPYALEAPDDR